MRAPEAAGANARSSSVQSRSAGEPIMAIVSLRNQRITVYDAKGWILRAPVSSGTKGRETPAGHLQRHPEGRGALLEPV